jgi:hypothetical protein
LGTTDAEGRKFEGRVSRRRAFLPEPTHRRRRQSEN